MSQWIIRGLATGIKTTRYPHRIETASGTSPGFPAATAMGPESARSSLAASCPTGALEPAPAGIDVNPRRCIHCFRCVRGTGPRVDWNGGYEWAGMGAADNKDGNGAIFDSAFGRSIHILTVDVGDCGACLNEVRQLNNPYYNIHRLGFFFTPTPRHADVLLVVGALTEHMRLPVIKAYMAMPGPKRIVAVGACALSGGIFAGSFACAGGIADLLPVDVEVPGNPPPPLAIIHGLLVVAGRKPPVGSNQQTASYTGAENQGNGQGE